MGKQEKEKTVRTEREAAFGSSLVVFLICIVVIMGGIVGFGLDAHIPLVGAMIVLMIYGVVFLHIPYAELQKSMLESIKDSLECLLILLSIGMLIAAWMACGTVPYIIYLGLGLLSPQLFLL